MTRPPFAYRVAEMPGRVSCFDAGLTQLALTIDEFAEAAGFAGFGLVLVSLDIVRLSRRGRSAFDGRTVYSI
jgi:hypothetical protein